MSTADGNSNEGGESGKKRKIDNRDDDDDDEVAVERKNESEHEENVRSKVDLEASNVRNGVLEAEVLLMREENERIRMESERETLILGEEIERLSRDDDHYIGTSTLDEETGELTYRGGHLSDDIDMDLILSVRVCDYVKSIAGGRVSEDRQELVAESAFSDCIFINTVHLSVACKKINDFAFLGCSALKTIDIQHVTSSGEDAFANSGLTAVTIPHGLTVITDGAFACCDLLTTVIIHDNVTSIENGVFYRCPLLTNIRIPDACTVHEETFKYCSALLALAVAKNFPNIESYLRYRYRLPAFVYPTLVAMNICDIRMAANGDINDGIGANEERDVVVSMYRKLKVADLWRRVLGYVRL